ncbi:protein FAR1-RELATED SEQUENCE 12-like [Dioscorea cayenensis subsp. rotundata]|uniref:Protein FAR1-RELATED SEQUENCE n=1 Tax=Dioscorea cayennensis subsp. rotundata TaxID=55577 RepID=A0AB40AV67_DIOCR|nr:protein FAR1-RELATED SEQUENCE 12-like [Dioscorea cayenensis subsp. rotundata]
MFKRFEDELMESIGSNCVKGASDEYTSIYQLIEDGHARVYFVTFSHSNGNISCSCHMFETLGLLCHHTLWIFVMNNVKEIPKAYIMKRWTKRAKPIFINDFNVGTVNEEKSTRLLQLSELNHNGYNLFDRSSLIPKCTKIVKDKLIKALELVEKEKATLKDVQELENASQKTTQEDVGDGSNEDFRYSIHEKLVLDPIHIKTKGSKGSRMKSQLEKC